MPCKRCLNVDDSVTHSLSRRFFFGRALACAHAPSPSGKEFERLCREEFGAARDAAHPIIALFRIASACPTIPWCKVREHVCEALNEDGDRVMSPLLRKIANLPDTERVIFRIPFPNASVVVGKRSGSMVGKRSGSMVAGEIMHPNVQLQHEQFFHNSASEGDGGNLSAVGLPILNEFTNGDATASTFSAKDSKTGDEEEFEDCRPASGCVSFEMWSCLNLGCILRSPLVLPSRLLKLACVCAWHAQERERHHLRRRCVAW